MKIANFPMRPSTLSALLLSLGIHGLALWLLIGVTANVPIPTPPLASAPLQLRIASLRPIVELSESPSISAH